MRRKVLISATAVILLAVGVMYVAVPRLLQSIIVQRIEGLNRSGAVKISPDKLTVGILGAHAERIVMWYPRYLLSLELHQPRARVSLLSLLQLRPTLSIQAKLYEGDLEGRLVFDPGNDGLQLSFNLEEMQLQKLPALAFLNLASGKLKASTAQFTLASKNGAQGSVVLHIADLNMPHAIQIPRLNGSKETLSLPSITDFTAQATLKFGGTEILIEGLNSVSSLGRISSRDSFPASKIETANLDCTLSASGQQAVHTIGQLSRINPFESCL